MAKARRYRNAMVVTDAAVNPKVVARSLVEAIDEVCMECGSNLDVTDPAVRLISHTLTCMVFSNAASYDADYGKDLATCRERMES